MKAPYCIFIDFSALDIMGNNHTYQVRQRLLVSMILTGNLNMVETYGKPAVHMAVSTLRQV